MGNCCCKSGAAGAVAASQSDDYGGASAGTGRSHLGAGNTFGTSSKGKKGGAVRLRSSFVITIRLLFCSNGQSFYQQGGVGGVGFPDPNYGAIESTSSVKVAVVVS